MASNIYLVSGGTNYYISGGGASQTVYAGSGTPWTAQSTTPYEIAMNDVVGGSWTPQVAMRAEVYGGGPPFRNGQTLIYDSYGNVTETLTIQMRATTHDNAVFLLQQLRRILNTALFSTPCTLAVQPNGSSNVTYYDIYGADVQEDPRFINEEATISGLAFIRALVTWRRSPHGTLITAGETVINAVTFNNTGTGSPDNVDAMSAGSGDLIYEGQPLNISFKPGSVGSTTVLRTWLGSILNRTYSTTGAGALSTTNSISTPVSVTLANWTMTDKLTNAGIKPRVMARFSTAPNGVIVFALLINVTDSGTTAGTIYSYQTPWVSANVATLATNFKLLDLGTFPVDILRRNGVVTAPAVRVNLLYASTSGGSATATLDYTEYIWYYDWCRIDTFGNFSTDGTQQLNVDQYPEASGVPATPWPAPMAFVNSSSSQMKAVGDTRGRLPRYFSGASLYAAWVNNGGGHTTTHSATVSARVSPQWQTFRGND